MAFAMTPLPRFVILRHQMPPESHRRTHWDLMLERDAALQTWALDECPVGERDIAARQLAAHRIAYLDYQGPLSRGRGAVERWDAGTYALSVDQPERIVAELRGGLWRCRLTLRCVDQAADQWFARFDRLEVV